MQPHPESPSLSRGLFRGLTRRCPRCGSGKLFRHWVEIAEECPRCGLRFANEDGYWTGSMAINLGVTEATFLIVFVGVIVATFPDVPWGPLLIAVIVVTALTPVVFHPISRTTWVAVERHVRGWEQ